MNKSPLLYVGGKYYMVEEIISLLDYSRACYIELFFGAGHVFFAKRPHKVEIINDIDSDLINFYKVLRDCKEELIEYLDYMPYSRELYESILRNWKNGLKGKSDLERAANYFYLIRSCFSGKLGSGWSYGYTRSRAKSYRNTIKLLNASHARIRYTMIENRDFREILDSIKKDREKEIVIYVDPPYIGLKYYNHNFSQEDHEDLAKRLNELKDCKIIVSYYYDKLLEDLYPRENWRWLFFKKTKMSQPYTLTCDKKTKDVAHELLLVNFEPKEQYHLFGRNGLDTEGSREAERSKEVGSCQEDYSEKGGEISETI